MVHGQRTRGRPAATVPAHRKGVGRPGVCWGDHFEIAALTLGYGERDAVLFWGDLIHSPLPACPAGGTWHKKKNPACRRQTEQASSFLGEWPEGRGRSRSAQPPALSVGCCRPDAVGGQGDDAAGSARLSAKRRDRKAMSVGSVQVHCCVVCTLPTLLSTSRCAYILLVY